MSKPLTVKELRKMNEQPVWVEFEDGSGGLWGIVHISVFEQIVFPNGLHCTIGHPYYGKTYEAYAYLPAHIDREAWEPCGCCKSCDTCLHDTYSKKDRALCRLCHKHEYYEPKFNYCHICGRPLKEKAWAMPEKRIRGAV